MRIVIGITVALWMSFYSHGQENNTASATHYISDDVFVFMHTGPGKNYRIRGSVAAGMGVTRTDSAETGGFVEIIDPQGRSGWIEVGQLATEPSFRARVTELQETLASNQATVRPLQQQVNRLRAELSSLQESEKTLQTQLEDANSTIMQLEREQAKSENAERIQWLLNGGGLAAGCVLLGVLLTYLPRKRKRNDGWMD